MEKRKDNITNISRDNRLVTVRVTRSAALIGLLLLCVLLLWRYREDLNAASARQLMAYLKSASYSDVVFEKFESDSGLSTAAKPLGVGLAVVQSDYYYYVAGNGRVEFSSQLKYAAPVMETAGKTALIYDSGNRGYSVVTEYSILRSAEADGAIITGAIAESGDYAVVSNTSGFRSAVTVFSSRHKERCKWETSSQYVIMVSIAPDASTFSAVCVASDGTDMAVRLVCFDIASGEQVYSETIACASVYSLRHTEKSDVMLVTDDGIYIFGRDGEQKSFSDFGGKVPQSISHYEQGDCLMIFGGDEINTVSAVRYDANGEIADSFTAAGTLRACDCRGDTVSLLMDTRLIWKDPGGLSELAGISARGVMTGSDSVPILVYTDRIERAEDK